MLPAALQQAQDQGVRLQQPVIALIEQCLAQDPKPAYQRPAAERRYGVRFWDLNVCWHYPHHNCIRVLSVEQLPEARPSRHQQLYSPQE